MHKRTWILLLAMAGCMDKVDGSSSTEDAGDSDTDSDIDADSDADTDADSDTDTDTDSDTDTDTDADSDTDTDTDTGPVPFGPDNAWFHANTADVPAGLTGTGNVDLGERPDDFLLVDQNGDQVSLYQFYGKTVQIVLIAQWCAPCQGQATLVADTARDLADDDVIVIEVMLDDVNGDPPTEVNLQEWVSAYGATHPVLADANRALMDWLISSQFPTSPILNGELIVVVENNTLLDPAVLAAEAP